MSSKELAQAAKAKGNACLSAKDFDGAIKHYTEVRERSKRGSSTRVEPRVNHACAASTATWTAGNYARSL
jgi:hypothetical protein